MAADDFNITDPSTGNVKISGSIVDPGATEGDVLTVNADGSIGAASGAAPPIQTGSGDPSGSVVPTGIGYLYIDLTAGALWIAVGATNADWSSLGGANGIQTGITLTPDQPDFGVADSNNSQGFSVLDHTSDGTVNSLVRTSLNTLDDGTVNAKIIPHTTIDPSNFPTSDPADGGHSIWSNIGVLTVSS